MEPSEKFSAAEVRSGGGSERAEEGSGQLMAGVGAAVSWGLELYPRGTEKWLEDSSWPAVG